MKEALQTFIEVKEKERRRADYSDRLREVRRKTSNLNLRFRATELIRSDRNSLKPESLDG